MQAGIAVYVGLWAYMRFKEWWWSRRSRVNAFQIYKYEERSLLVKSFGWVFILIIGCGGVWIFPEVYIVTQGHVAIPEDGYEHPYLVRGSFDVERGFVPFFYKGQGCVPFCSYISNETDSALVLYKTELFNGAYIAASTPRLFKTVPARSLIDWNDPHYQSWFRKPEESRHGYVPKGQRNKRTVTWTLDLRECAEKDCEEIENIIRHGKNSYKWPDSITVNAKYRVPFTPPEGYSSLPET